MIVTLLKRIIYFQVSPLVLASLFISGLASAIEPERDTDGDPAKKFIENLPATKNLPRVRSIARSVPAFSATRSSSGPHANKSLGVIVPGYTWTALGPFPIPNGQTQNRVDPVSGRVTVIAVNPTNADTAYVGTAQGGLYRTLNGGSTWAQLMDNAVAGAVGTPLAIGSVVIDPTNPSTLLVGTGEGNLSQDSFFGTGFYIITNADTFNPVVSGPYNLNSSSQDIFTGRSIVAIAVDPTNHNNVFVATSSGQGGIVAATNSVLPARGLYRSMNAFSGSPTWTRLQVAGTSTNTIATSLVMEPDNPNNLVVSFYGQSGADPSGIYRTTNALDPAPTFTVSQALANFVNVKMAINKVASVVTVFATADVSSGTLYKSTNGGATFTNISVVNGFAGGQGFYDIAVGLDPTNANNVSVGGNTGANIFLFSTNGGTSFGSSVTGLHADVHAVTYAPSNPSVIYHGNDGGIWRSTDGGANWTALNNSTFSATQFEGLAVHPSDRNFSIGGTQDNGTEFLKPDGTFTRADFGDGGYSLIDQNAPDTTNVVMYHTYYNQTNNLIGTGRVLTAPCASDANWSFHGIYGGAVDPSTYCDGTSDTFNGISLTDTTQFYAPQTLGPGNPNTWYFGTNKLYRSIDRANTAAAVSQVFQAGVAVSAIAISPQNDNVRLAGLTNGKVWATTTGANPMLQVAGVGATNGTTTTPAVGVGRIIVDPNNSAVAYLAFVGSGGGFAHVWKTTNLNALPAGSVIWTAMSNGLPDVAANAFAIDPDSAPAGGSSQSLYVGMDTGVYHSSDGGANWSAYGSGLPRVSTFAMENQNSNSLLRVGTHGRGMYEIPTALELVSAVSRLTHTGVGSFDVNLPFSGPPPTECRDANGNFQIVIHYTNGLAAGSASVTNHNPAGSGMVSSVTTSGNDLIVNLFGVTDKQILTLSITGITDTNGSIAPDTSLNIGFLIGDTSSDKKVNAVDISQVKSHSGENTNATNFREDINLGGDVGAADISAVKAHSGNQLP